jgi:hypothetical protein
MVKMVSMKSSATLERVPDLHPVVILKGDLNKGHEVSVLMVLLEFNHKTTKLILLDSLLQEREAGDRLTVSPPLGSGSSWCFR